MRNRIITAAALYFFFGMQTSHAFVNPDEVVVYVPAFEGKEALGLNVATILQLQLWQTFRRYPWPLNPQNDDYGKGTILWDPRPLPEATHDAAEKAAKSILISGQIVLWGKAFVYGDGVVAQSNITLPKYNDLREENFEVWRLTLGGQAIEVDVPRRRFELSSIVLSPGFVERYSTPAALIMYDKPTGGRPVGVVGDDFKGLEVGSDLAKVKSRGVIGWLRLPNLLQSKTDVIDMVAGIVRVYRGDWAWAETAFSQVISNAGVRPRLKLDAYLYRGIVKERNGRSGRDDFERAYEISPYDRKTVEYLVMSDLSRIALKQIGSDRVDNIRTTIREEVDRHIHLFATDDAWLAKLNRILEGL